MIQAYENETGGESWNEVLAEICHDADNYRDAKECYLAMKGRYNMATSKKEKAGWQKLMRSFADSYQETNTYACSCGLVGSFYLSGCNSDRELDYDFEWFNLSENCFPLDMMETRKALRDGSDNWYKLN